MKSNSDCEHLPSRRNQVLRFGDSVEKRLATDKAAQIEFESLSRLSAAGLRVPTMLEKDGNTVKMRRIPGETIPDFLQHMEASTDRPLLKAAAESVVGWLGDFYQAVTHEITGEIRGDVNGRNFLLDGGICSGVDFEERIYGEREQDIGRLIAFIETYDPPGTEVKRFFAGHLRKTALSALAVDSERIERHRRKELEAMRIRRAKGKPKNEDGTMSQRYERQTMIPEIGPEGQRKIASAKVAVVGAGGLGSSVIYHLASAGVGEIVIIDSDTVESSNLNRQFLHFEADIGKNKASSAAEKISLYNSAVRITAITERLEAENAERLLLGCDMAIACVDNCHTRSVMGSACQSLGIPMADGGIGGFAGYTLVLLPGITPCYQCAFPFKPAAAALGAENIGVLGAAAGVIGSLMTLEAIKLLTGKQPERCLHYIDMMTLRITPVTTERKPDCPVCAMNQNNPPVYF